MEVQETPVPKRRRVSPLWVIPLLVVVALGVDSALLTLRDASAKASTVALQSKSMGPGEACGGNCGGGGCGMTNAAGAKESQAACPGSQAIAAKQGTQADKPAVVAKPGATATKAAGVGGCPMMKPGATTKPDAPAGGCPMTQSGAAAKPKAAAAGGSCPMMKSGAAATSAHATTGKCPAGASCGKETGSACPNGGDESCAAQKTTAKPVASEKPAAAYVCTMCPDVKSDKPGNCPKCGMALVKKAQ